MPRSIRSLALVRGSHHLVQGRVSHINVWSNIDMLDSFDLEEGGGESEDGSEELWPTEGKIEFQNVWLRYRNDLDHVLKGIDLTIEARHKGP